MGGVSLCGNVSRLCKQPVTHHIAMSLTLGLQVGRAAQPLLPPQHGKLSQGSGLLGAWLPRVPDGVAEAQGLSSATVTQLGVS